MREYTRQEQEAAAVAAKLIAAEGRTWARAFRDAQRSVGIRPDPNLTASEIRRWFALFAPHEHQALLAAKRHAALHVMRSVPELNCRLIGVVLSGAAVETSPAELVAIGTGEKEAFLALLNAGFLPEPLDAPYPTAFARRVGEKLPFMATENVMMESVKRGGNRQELHEIIRVHSHAAARAVKDGKPNDLIDRLASDPAISLGRDEIVSQMNPAEYVGRSAEQVDEFIEGFVRPVLEKYPDLGTPTELKV